ncbi:hypothetical protein [Collimonas antrihumi]|uniref:hypothetical protein n=1 Tax=Collimonas antrihumi TaxID=1940615 RepID=UPI001B8B483B|nr:hypothetical protein [Collimonas antrihumi]
MEDDEYFNIDITKPPKNGMALYAMDNGDQLIHTERGALIIRSDGSSVLMQPNGPTCAIYQKTFQVAVTSLVEVTRHSITQVDDKTEHILVFRGGGVLSCSVVKGNPFIRVACLSLGFKYDNDSAVMNVTNSIGIEPLPISIPAGISDVCNIFNHQITKADGVTTHFLQDYNGWNQQFACNDHGEWIENSVKLASWPPRDRDGNRTTPKKQVLNVKLG